MVDSCQNTGPYDPALNQAHCAQVPAANSDPHHAAFAATTAGGHQIMKHLRLAGGRRRKRKTESMRGWRQSWRQMGGDVICPAAVPAGSSSWPTFPNQDGPFSTAQNANTASQTNNALSASTKAQAMYDHEAGNIPPGLEGTPQAGGRRRKSIAKRRHRSGRRTRRQRKGGKRSRVRAPRGRTKGRTRRQRKGRTRRHRGGHQDRWRTWGCSSGGGAHGGLLVSQFRKHLDMLRHKLPYP